jgi:hypothetical protein
MAQSTFPTDENRDSESPAERLVRLLEQNGLEDGQRNILESLEARRSDQQREIRRQLLDEYLLEGQPPLTQQELEQARRECQE